MRARSNEQRARACDARSRPAPPLTHRPSRVVAFFSAWCSGEGRVGKTSLVLRFCRDTFTEGQAPTIQASCLERAMRLGDRNINLVIWDTAGQERFHALGPIYYRDADAALLVFDITDTDSFKRVHMWVRELRKMVRNAHFCLCPCRPGAPHMLLLLLLLLLRRRRRRRWRLCGLHSSSRCFVTPQFLGATSPLVRGRRWVAKFS